jgi:hypothetical protein
MRKLASGDYQATTTTEGARKTLEENSGWTRVIAPSAAIKTKTYTVWAHGVRVAAVDASNQAQAIETIRNMNARLHPNLGIARVAWTMTTLKIGKRYGALIIEMESIESANRLISQGLIHEGELKYCERFIRDARVT